MIEQIIVHKSLLDSFKRKAVKALPHEVIVAVLGKMVNDDLHIYAFDELEIESSTVNKRKMMLKYGQPEEEMEAGTTLKYFGTLHSHPNATTEPSEEDKKDFLEKFNAEEFHHAGLTWEYLHDEIMGIMSLAPKKRVIHYGFTFYNIDFEQIHMVVSEDKKGKTNEDYKTNTKVIAKRAGHRRRKNDI